MLSALRLICRQARRSHACMFSSRYPELLCQPQDPNCHHVPDDNCESAKIMLNQKLPRVKFLEQDYEPVEKCCILRSARRDPCAALKRPKPKHKPRKPFRSMWTPPCLTAEQPFCKDLLPRFDAIYYQPSDKCRCYPRTWRECPPVKRRLKKVCCLDGITPPEVLYRVKVPCPNICGVDYHRLRRLCADVELERDPFKKCPKLFQPCCKKLARCDPHCRKLKFPTNCTKLRAPYPSYSEQVRPRRVLRGVECRCLDPVPACVYLREYVRRMEKNLKLY